MKFFVEFESEDELRDFMRWRAISAATEKKIKELTAAMQELKRCEIASIGWPPHLVTIALRANVTTVAQASAMTDTEWLKTPRCGRRSLKEMRELIAARAKEPEPEQRH